MNDPYDVIIVGGGPAGLSAALILGRCRRRVIVLDSGKYRNGVSHGLHGYLTRDCIEPAEFLAIAREQLKPYGVEVRRATAQRVERLEPGFRVHVAGNGPIECRKLLLATGVVDRLPSVPGIEPFYGRSVFHCPYCDGWEMRDQPLAVYARRKSGAGLAVSLKTWTADVVLCTDGRPQLTREEEDRLQRYSIPVRSERIARLEGENGVLRAIVFESGDSLPRRGMFFTTGQDQSCSLATDLGCRRTRKGAIRTGHLEGTTVPGLFVAGDASKDVQLVIVAAAEGAKAGFAINTALQDEGQP